MKLKPDNTQEQRKTPSRIGEMYLDIGNIVSKKTGDY